MNDVKLLGRLAKDPTLYTTKDNVSVAFATIAVSRPKDKTKTDYIEFVCYEKTADNLVKYNKKGDELLVVAELRSYKKDGKSEQGLIAESVTYLRRKSDNTEKTQGIKDTSDNGLNTSPEEVPSGEIEKETLADKVMGFFK